MPQIYFLAMDTEIQYGEYSFCLHLDISIMGPGQSAWMSTLSASIAWMGGMCSVGTSAQVMAGEPLYCSPVYLRHTYGCDMKILVLLQKSLQAQDTFKNSDIF